MGPQACRTAFVRFGQHEANRRSAGALSVSDPTHKAVAPCHRAPRAPASVGAAVKGELRALLELRGSPDVVGAAAVVDERCSPAREHHPRSLRGSHV